MRWPPCASASARASPPSSSASDRARQVSRPMSPHDGGTAALSFPHAAPPAPAALTEVAPGVRWLRMPLPFALDHINLWLLDEGDGWSIVDSGLNTVETQDLWQRIFAAELGGKPVKRLIVTHFHPDHMGLAGWLTETLNVPLWCTETE